MNAIHLLKFTSYADAAAFAIHFVIRTGLINAGNIHDCVEVDRAGD